MAEDVYEERDRLARRVHELEDGLTFALEVLGTTITSLQAQGYQLEDPEGAQAKYNELCALIGRDPMKESGG